MQKCKYCGSENGFYSKDSVKARVQTYYNFDGSEGDNSGMYDSLEHTVGKKAYCMSCDKILGN